MKGMTVRLVLFAGAALLAACGQIATPMVTQRPPATETGAEATQIVLEPTAALEVTEAATEMVTEEATEAPAEVTEVATEAPTEEATEAATAEATEMAVEPTEEATEASAAAAFAGDPVAGQELFVTGNTSAGAPPCSTCHLVDSEITLVGPGLLNVATRAETRVPGETALEYLHQSIVDPAAYVAEGFVPGMMPDIFDQAFTEEQINDIIAYLLTLHD
jgi:cytochrome c